MLQITHVITTIDRGGAEKHLLQLASAQVAAGYRVRVIFLKGKAELLQDFERSGCEVIAHISNKGLLQQFLGLRAIFSGFQGVTHAHLPKAELLSALSVSNKIIVSRHNAEKFFPAAPDFLSRLLSQLVSRKTYGCIAISNSVKDFLYQSKEWPKTPCVTVVHYGVERRHLNPTIPKEILLDELGIPRDYRVIGTIARVVPQKDYPTLLAAFKILSEHSPDVFLVSVGEGNLLPEMSRLAMSLGISHRVKWVGKVENVDNYLQLFDSFVLTSIYEGFGLVLLEAANADLPIVASNISAIPEVLGSDHKYLATAGNPVEFAAMIINSLNDKDSASLSAWNDQIMENFSVEKMLQKTLKVYV
jgi:glycosyltransferase involved in cell wall biosynthesis